MGEESGKTGNDFGEMGRSVSARSMMGGVVVEITRLSCVETPGFERGIHARSELVDPRLIHWTPAAAKTRVVT